MIVSNSEITDFNTCERKHYYRFRLKMEPKHVSSAIKRGIVGHLALDTYYTHLKVGNSVEVAREAAIETLRDEIIKVARDSPEETELIQTLVGLRQLIEGYVQFYREEPFEVLETESKYTVNLVGDIDFALRLDLLIRFTKGEYRGDKAIVDHKFVYNFKNQAQLEMDVQLPKYIRVLKETGHVVSKGYFNQIRYRQLKDPAPSDIYKREKIARVSRAEMDNVWEEQIKIAKRIAELNSLPIEEHSKEVVRVLNPYTCKFCPFQRLCKLELQEQPITAILAVEYQPNTYGYDVEEYVDNG